nr:uncharacterized protein LOC117226311 [Megalopta genalis]
MGDSPKVEFALGSEVSQGHFFKSSFARAFVSSSATACSRDSKSLDHELHVNTIVEEPELSGNNGNNYFSLVNFGNGAIPTDDRVAGKSNKNPRKQIEAVKSPADISELEKLRKQCQSLIEENQRLQDALTVNRSPHTQMIDNVALQTQIETLQWQLKQVDSNRQMYRSLMEQVVRFLDRARNSLDILHKKNGLKDKGSSGRRSRSVHTVHDDSSPNRGACTSSSSSSSDSSRFIRAKSITQISPCTSGNREATWSVLRRNDPVHCTPPRSKSNDLNKTNEGVVYKRPKQQELDPNEIPPEKLSQEAFSLMRTAQTLLATREPDLARITPVDNTDSSPSPVDYDQHNGHHNEMPQSLQNNSFVNSTAAQGKAKYSRRRSNDHGRGAESDDRPCLGKSLCHMTGIDLSLENLPPSGRMSIDATSVNSGSSKTTEEEDAVPVNGTCNVPLQQHTVTFALAPTSTPNKPTANIEKKEKDRCPKTKQPASVCSVEDESGFSSFNSFQEIGLPGALPISPIRGYHTEIGLPEVPLDKARHRRWSSIPVEVRALLKQHRRSFATTQTNAESLSVWV